MEGSQTHTDIRKRKQTHKDTHRRMQMHTDERRHTQTNADECKTNADECKTNARQTVSGVWADTTSRRVQTLDVRSRTFGTYYIYIYAITDSIEVGIRCYSDTASI